MDEDLCQGGRQIQLSFGRSLASWFLTRELRQHLTQACASIAVVNTPTSSSHRGPSDGELKFGNVRVHVLAMLSLHR